MFEIPLFEEYALKISDALTQLSEGAITAHEFFNFSAARLSEVMEDPGYQEAQVKAAAEMEIKPSWFE